MQGNLVEYFGWVTSLSPESVNKDELQKVLSELNCTSYPLCVSGVNGSLHVQFSGCPNHYQNEAYTILEYVKDFPETLGIVYLINHDTGEHPTVLKLEDNHIIEISDNNLSKEKYQQWLAGDDD